MRKQYETAEARLEREGRRARRAEENVAALRKQLKQAEAPVEAEPSAELAAAVEEALAALQRGLGRQPAPEREVLPETASRPSAPPARLAERAPLPPSPADALVTLPAGRSKRTYRASQIRQAIA